MKRYLVLTSSSESWRSKTHFPDIQTGIWLQDDSPAECFRIRLSRIQHWNWIRGILTLDLWSFDFNMQDLNSRFHLAAEVMSLSDNAARQNVGRKHVQGFFQSRVQRGLGDHHEPFWHISGSCKKKKKISTAYPWYQEDPQERLLVCREQPHKSGSTPTLTGQPCPLTKRAAPCGWPWFKKTKVGKENKSERNSVHVGKKEEGPFVFSLCLCSFP